MKKARPKPTLEDAISLAARLHAGQLDRALQPYILHPLRVMLRMATEEERIVAVLHDTMEDCGASRRLLENLGYSPRVVDAVEALTKQVDDGGKPTEEYLAFVARAGRNPLARCVKVADLMDNMDLSRLPSPTAGDRERVKRYRRALKLISRG